MLRIEPHALYTRSDLAAMLDGSGVDVDFFVARIKARKVFKMLWQGEDILTALRAAPALGERENAPGNLNGVPQRKSFAPIAREGNE